MRTRHTHLVAALLLCACPLGLAACGSSAPKADATVKEQPRDDAAQKEAEALGLDRESWQNYKKATALVTQANPDPAGALELLKGVVEKSPDFAEAHYNIAMIYERQGKADDARRHLERAREIDPEAAEYKVAMGRLYAQTKDYEKAKILFDEVVARDATNQAAKNNLAVLALEQGDLKKAKEYVIEILREDDDNVPALMTLGLIYKTEKNLSLAKYVFEKAKTTDKANPDIYNNLGLVYLMEENPQRAVSAFGEANEADKGYIQSRLNLGAVLLEYLDYERADKQFGEALAIDNSHCVANVGYGATQYALGKYEEAVKHYAFYVDNCDPKHISSYERMAKLNEGPLKNPEAAIEQYRKLLSLTTNADQQAQYKAMIGFLESQKNQPKTPEEPAVQPEGEASEEDEGSTEEVTE